MSAILTEEKPIYLFLGAGVSFTSGIRTANNLARLVGEEIEKYDPEVNFWGKQLGIKEMADFIDKRKPATKFIFKDLIAKNLSYQASVISPEYRMLAFLVKKKMITAIYTTNQDDCLEQALDSQGISYNRFIYPYKGSLIPFANGNVDIFKLCGDIHSPYEMCFSESELQNATHSNLFKNLIKHFKQNCKIIFIGYSAYNDPIGNCLRTASDQRTRKSNCATLFFVDINQTEGHRTLIETKYGDCFIGKTAEKFFRDEIFEIKPRLNVKHALWNLKGFGGIQTYTYSLMELGQEFENNISTSYFETKSFFNSSPGDVGLVHGFEYDMASSKASTLKEICDSQPDVVHAHNFIVAQMCASLNIPCVFTSHSLESKEINIIPDDRENKPCLDPFKNDIKKYEEIYYRDLSNILVLSKSHYEEIPKDAQPSTRKIEAAFLLPEFLGINTSVTSSEKRKELQESLNLPYNIGKKKIGHLILNFPQFPFLEDLIFEKGFTYLIGLFKFWIVMECNFRHYMLVQISLKKTTKFV